MNIQSPIDGNAREAKLRYLPGDYMILSPGAFVRCAVTGTPGKAARKPATRPAVQGWLRETSARV